jgi:hypothetical protein
VIFLAPGGAAKCAAISAYFCDSDVRKSRARSERRMCKTRRKEKRFGIVPYRESRMNIRLSHEARREKSEPNWNVRSSSVQLWALSPIGTIIPFTERDTL